MYQPAVVFERGHVFISHVTGGTIIWLCVAESSLDEYHTAARSLSSVCQEDVSVQILGVH